MADAHAEPRRRRRPGPAPGRAQTALVRRGQLGRATHHRGGVRLAAAVHAARGGRGGRGGRPQRVRRRRGGRRRGASHGRRRRSEEHAEQHDAQPLALPAEDEQRRVVPAEGAFAEEEERGGVSGETRRVHAVGRRARARARLQRRRGAGLGGTVRRRQIKEEDAAAAGLRRGARAVGRARARCERASGERAAAWRPHRNRRTPPVWVPSEVAVCGSHRAAGAARDGRELRADRHDAEAALGQVCHAPAARRHANDALVGRRPIGGGREGAGEHRKSAVNRLYARCE